MHVSATLLVPANTGSMASGSQTLTRVIVCIIPGVTGPGAGITLEQHTGHGPTHPDFEVQAERVNKLRSIFLIKLVGCAMACSQSYDGTMARVVAG